jgi:hypothetical protein
MIKRISFGCDPVRPDPAAVRAVACEVIPGLSDPASPHQWITAEWFPAGAMPVATVGRLAVVAEEAVVRGAPWLEQRWKDGGPMVKHMALATRAAGLTQPEFAARWRAHAGTAGGARVPDEARGLAYVQNHPIAGQWPYDAVNEVYFDDLDGLRRRVEWFRGNVPAPADGSLFGQSWLVAVREVVIGRWSRCPGALWSCSPVRSARSGRASTTTGTTTRTLSLPLRPHGELGATGWNSTRYSSVPSSIGPACAARCRSVSRSGSPARRTSASVIAAKGMSSMESTSIRPRPGPTGYRPPTLTLGRFQSRNDTVISPASTSSRSS